jgi:hypothetical protein
MTPPAPDVRAAYRDVRPDAIPAALHAQPWVLWRAEPRPGDPKPAKVPARIADPDQRASSTDPATWGSFADAVEAYSMLAGVAHPRGPIAGIGVVLTAEAGLACLDLDGVLTGDTLDPRAARIVARCDSWTEVSPSGRGLHIFVRGRVPAAIKGAGIEVYAGKRFIAMTGHQWLGTPPGLGDAQSYLDRLAGLARPEPAPRPYTGSVTPPPDDLAGTLVNRLQGLGVAVSSLKRWNGGFLVELRECPWADQHTSGRRGAAVIIHPSGAYDFTCLHAHCAGRTWREFRAVMEPAR